MATNSKLKERRVASIAAFSKDGLLLFGRRADNKKWTLPGGHLEANETPMDGAKRELLEEAGLEGSDYEYLGNGTVTEGLTIFSYRCVVDGEPTAEDDPDAEMMSWRWVEPDSIPDEIMENLHSPKNITLRLLGLQDGEVGGLVKSDIQAQKPIAVKHYSPVAGLTRLDPKFQGTAAAGQERNRTKRIPRTYYYLRHAAPETHVSSGGNLYYGELPAGTKLYDMSADHLQLLKPKMQQTNAGMVFRPVDFDQVEKKLAKLGYHGYHSYGPQGALAYFHPLAVRPGVERNLKKGLGGLALAGAVALGLGGGPTPQQTSNKVVQAPQLPQWTPEGLHPDMYPIAHLESSWGKNVAHSVNKKGDFHTAFGALGFKPVTAHEEYLKSPFMQKTYPGHSSPDKFLQKFKQDPKFYNLLASAHFARLTAKHGGPAQASYAWRWGSGAAHKASPEQIKNDLYVQKYTASNLHQKQSLQKAEPTGKDWTAIASETVKRAKASEPKIRKEAERQGLHPFLHQPDKYHQTPPSWDTGWCHAASKAFQKEHPEVELHDFVEPDFERFNEWGSVAHVAPYIPSIGKYMDFNHGLVDAQHLANRFFSLDDKENRIEPHDVDRAASQLYTAAPGKNSQLTDIIHEHLFGDNTAIQKSEDLIKMAVGTIKPGAPIAPSIRMRHSADGYRLDTHKVFDYSHHLTPEQQNAGYALHVYDGVNNSDGTKTVNVHLHRPNFLDSSVGDLAGEIFGKDLGVTYSQVKEQHRRQGLGQKMYEAAYAHAFHHHGVNSVSGTDHSSMAAKVHRKLNETHGFKYKPESVSRWQTRKPEGPFDSKYYGYKYFIKSEEDPLESMLHHEDPRERILALKSHLCTPYHLRLALQDEDQDVRAAAVLHPMMTSPLLEEALSHPDIHTRRTALSRHDLQDHHLEQALWDPELQAQAALHPCLTEEQRQKILSASDTPSGLRNELLAKSVGFLTYPKLGQPTIATKPMVREPEAHHRMAIASGAQTITNGYIHYPRLRTPLPPGGAWMSSSMKGGMPPNAHLATEGHESQHSVFAALRQRYGDDAGHRIVATTLAALDPTEHQHLRNITDWKVKFRYSPAREAEERIAHLHNYLLDPGFRNTSHKAMKIFHDPEAQQAAHTKAKGIFQKLRLAAQTLTPQSVGLIPTGVFQKSLIKSWVQDKTKVDGYSVHEDMLGLNHKSDTYLSAAKFLANLDPDEGVFRRCLLADTDMTEAALTSVGLEVTDKSRKALEAILRLQSSDLSKSSNQVEVLALMPESEQVAASVLRGFQADRAKGIQLNGKHSAGAMKVDDPESNQVYLLKPGSGRQNSAAGVQEEPASQSRREAAFWAVADLCGLGNRIPRTDLLLINGREVATLHMLPMEWMNLERLKVKDSGLPHKALEKYRQSGELHKWAILDYVLGNADRHGSNIMVGEQKDGYPVALIDHGSAFSGLDFDPANDKNSFVPYYLRAWKAEGWGSLDFEQKLRSMPVVSGDVEAQLRSWLEGLHADAIEQVLHRYGIDPSASLTRLAKIKALLSTPNLSEAVNRLWLAA